MPRIGNLVCESNGTKLHVRELYGEGERFYSQQLVCLSKDKKLHIRADVAAKFGISIVMDDGNTEAKRVDYHIVEVCPHCESEIHLAWSPKDDGFEIFCPKCGEKIMLCDACFHLDEYDVEPNQQHPPGSCDWCEDTGCWRKNREEG